MTPLEARLALSQDEIEQLREFREMAVDINRRHNLYSRSSVSDFWSRHVLHSLSLASRAFPAGARVVDWGTGGGLPGIPLAIVFPDVEFILVDVIEKKVRAAATMARRLGLQNVEAVATRAEDFDRPYHYAVSRATAPLADLWTWTLRNLQPMEVPPGHWNARLLALKGGDLRGEVQSLVAIDEALIVETHPLSDLLPVRDFAEKVIVTVDHR